MITSLHLNFMISSYQPARTDNLCVGNTYYIMQTVGYNAKYSTKYVMIPITPCD